MCLGFHFSSCFCSIFLSEFLINHSPNPLSPELQKLISSKELPHTTGKYLTYLLPKYIKNKTKKTPQKQSPLKMNCIMGLSDSSVDNKLPP